MRLKSLLENFTTHNETIEIIKRTGDFSELTPDLKHALKHRLKLVDCNLKSLRGNPSEGRVVDHFQVNKNLLTDFEGFPAGCLNGVIDLSENKFRSLENIHKHITSDSNRALDISYNPIISHVLGILMIKGLFVIKYDHWQKKWGKIIQHFLDLKAQGGLSKELVIECQNHMLSDHRGRLDKLAQL